MNEHDFISRSALLEKAKAIYIDHDNVALTHRVVSAVDIYLAPDADVVPMDHHERCMELEVKKRIAAEKTARQCVENYEPVTHGYWMLTQTRVSSSRGEHYTLATCSECKTVGSPMWKRCPVCEAKMDGMPSKEG